MVVEVTPLGIQNLQWQFYIIWTIFNFAFLPIIYFFYPETADRTLEDVDRFFRENHDIFVFRHKDAISPKRPAKYIEIERQEVRRASSVDPEMWRRESRVGYALQAAEEAARKVQMEEREEAGRGKSLEAGEGVEDGFEKV